MIHLGLIGYPLGHSLSPRIHTAALQACGMEGSYSLFPIPPEDERSLRNLFSRVRSGEIHGLNVTIPHKQTVIQFLDELTPAAAAIGAVNTISLRADRLVGDNTDAQGFLSDLHRFLAMGTQGHANLSSLVLGSGGSARAVIYALRNDGWDVTVAARRIEQARQLAESIVSDHLRITNFTLSGIDVSEISLVVNTTPVGMTPNADQSPWPEHVRFPENASIYDLVYHPQETRLVRDARRQGLPAATGLGMLVEQAALSFQIWTDQTPSRQQMRESAEQSLGSTHQSPITSYGAP